MTMPHEESAAMDLVLLKTFVKVVELGSITKAASVLFVTQSAVSRRMKQLESFAGTPLLERSGNLLAPTEAGRLLIEKTHRMLDIEQEIVDIIGARNGRRKISFCCTPSLGIDRMTGVISSFIADHAATVELSCVFAMPEEALEGIDSGRFDLVLIDHCDEIDLKGRDFRPLPDDMVFCLASPALGLDAEETAIQRILGERLYLKNERGCAKRFVDSNLYRLGHSCSEFSSIVYFDDLSFIFHEVAAGNGVTFASAGMVAEELKSGRLRAHRIGGFNHCRPRSLVLARQGASRDLRSFIDTLLSAFGKALPDRP